MTLQRVKLKEIDDASPYGYPKRTLEIRTNKGDFYTPARAVTSHEYQQKVSAATDITYDAKANVFVERFGYNKLVSFLNENTPFENLSNRLRTHVERSQHSMLTLISFQPTATKNLEKKSALDLLQSSKKNREKFYRLIIQIQRLFNLDPISIPLFPLPDDELKETIRDITNYLNKEKLSYVFFLDMNKKFPSLLKYLISDLQQPLIGIHYKKYTQAVQSYETIRSFHAKDVAFLMTNTTRDDSQNENISTMHYLPFLSNDIFSSFVPPPFMGGDGTRPTYEESVAKIKMFNKKQLALEKLSKKIDVDEIIRDVGRPNDNKIRDMLLNYDKGTVNDKLTAVTRLKSFSKVHEAKSSINEFIDLQKFIRDRDTKSYVESSSHSLLKRTLDKIR